MGMFVSLSGIIGKSHQQVEESFRRYALTHGGGLEPANIEGDYFDYCLIYQKDANTTLFYPNHFFEWDDASAWISKDLNTPVFSFHIHDGDFWMYCLYVNGQQVDQFNPLPDYWESLPEEETETWKGNATLLAAHIPGLDPSSVERYLVGWDIETADSEKAYTDDRYSQEDWQLLDFMRKTGFAWPADDDNQPLGQAYKMWTKGHPFPDRPTPQKPAPAPSTPPNPWWKLW